MIRETDLVSYLPPFMRDFKEVTGALEAENPEFLLVWKAADKALSNEFIETADEYGLSRFEKILNILPSKEDTIESRRARIQARWFNTVPGTVKGLIAKLHMLCGSCDLIIKRDFINYLLEIEIESDGVFFGQPEEVKNIVETMIPCNMKYNNCFSSDIPLALTFEREYYSMDLPRCGEYLCGQYPIGGGA